MGYHSDSHMNYYSTWYNSSPKSDTLITLRPYFPTPTVQRYGRSTRYTLTHIHSHFNNLQTCMSRLRPAGGAILPRSHDGPQCGWQISSSFDQKVSNCQVGCPNGLLLQLRLSRRQASLQRFQRGLRGAFRILYPCSIISDDYPRSSSSSSRLWLWLSLVSSAKDLLVTSNILSFAEMELNESKCLG